MPSAIAAPQGIAQPLLLANDLGSLLVLPIGGGTALGIEAPSPAFKGAGADTAIHSDTELVCVTGKVISE